MSNPRKDAEDCLEPWLEEIRAMYALPLSPNFCIPTIMDDSAGEGPGRPKGDEYQRDGYFEKPIGRIGGGPPPRGKPKPPPEPQPRLAEEVEALHRAMAAGRPFIPPKKV